MHTWLRNLSRTEKKRRTSRSSRQRRAVPQASRAKFDCMGIESLEQRVLLAADLSVSKTSDVSAPVQGQMIDYTISVQNVGDATATSSMLSDTLPSGLIPISASTDTGSVSMSGGAVTGNLGDLSAGVHGHDSYHGHARFQHDGNGDQ